jgi:hypothetical protein
MKFIDGLLTAIGMILIIMIINSSILNKKEIKLNPKPVCDITTHSRLNKINNELDSLFKVVKQIEINTYIAE